MTESELQAAVAREDLCRYLSACFYEPDAAFEEEGMFRALVEAAKRVDAHLVVDAEAMAQAFRCTGMDKLLLDYSRLFLGPTDILAKPYGSVWLDAEKTLMGKSTMAVLGLYGEADFEMDDDFKEVPDHVAVELEFLYALIFRENEARRNGNVAQLNAAIDLKRRFLSQHLGLWIGPFAAAVKDFAQCDFYRVLAELTTAFVGRESAANA